MGYSKIDLRNMVDDETRCPFLENRCVACASFGEDRIKKFPRQYLCRCN